MSESMKMVQTEGEEVKPKKGGIHGGWGLTLGVIAIILIIVFFIVWLMVRNRDTYNPGWSQKSILFSSTVTTGSFTAVGNSMAQVTGNAAGTVSVTASTSQPYNGRMFIIDNTANNTAIMVAAASGYTMVDNVGSTSGQVLAHTSAMYIWGTGSGATKTFQRLF